MLIQEGHAGSIIGKSGARIKELRLVVIAMVLHCISISDVQLISAYLNTMFWILS